MRKSLYALGAALCLALAVLAGVHLTVGSASDRVELAETVLTGDRSAAGGLAVTYLTNDNSNHLFWDVELVLGGALEPEASFQFYPGAYRRLPDRESSAFLSCVSPNSGMSGIIEENGGTSETDQMMLLPALDVAKRTGAGETRREVLRLRDYYDCFPVTLQVMASGGSFASDISSRSGGGDVQRKLNGYFRIPVPEDLLVTAEAERDRRGDLVRVSCEAGTEEDGSGGDQIWYEPLAAWGLVSADTVYLLTAPAGAGPDTVACGIHAIPILGVEQYTLDLDLDHIRLLRPLELTPEELLFFDWSGDGRRILLGTREEGRLVLTAIDPASGETVQRLELLDIGPEDWPGVLHCGDLHLVYAEGGPFALVREETGGFAQVLTGSLDLPEPLPDLLYGGPRLAWDGERLALVGHVRGRGRPDAPEDRRPGGLGAAVWDEDGLRYAGFFEYLPDRDWYNWPEDGYYRGLIEGEVGTAVFR